MFCYISAHVAKTKTIFEHCGVPMRLLLIGIGGVGEAIAVMAANKTWIEVMVLAGRKMPRLLEVQKRLGGDSSR